MSISIIVVMRRRGTVSNKWNIKNVRYVLRIFAMLRGLELNPKWATDGAMLVKIVDYVKRVDNEL